MKILSLLGILAMQGFAAIPTGMLFQGTLTDNGKAVNAKKEIVIQICDDLKAGSCVSGFSDSVKVSNGYYAVTLNTSGANFNKPLWLEVLVNDTLQGNARIPLTASPYAMQAANAVLADSAKKVRSDAAVLSLNNLAGDLKIVNGENTTVKVDQATKRISISAPKAIPLKIYNGVLKQVKKGSPIDPPDNTIWTTEAFYIDMTEFSANANLDDIANTFSAHASGWVFDLSSLEAFPLFLTPILSKDTSTTPNRLKIEFEVRCLTHGVKPWDGARWMSLTPLNEVHYTIIA